LIEDGSTLQMGIGAIPDAALAAMVNKKDLGIHTEMFSDGLVPLVEMGVINGQENHPSLQDYIHLHDGHQSFI
jgi:acyl-CoA hydrolase